MNTHPLRSAAPFALDARVVELCLRADDPIDAVFAEAFRSSLDTIPRASRHGALAGVTGHVAESVIEVILSEHGYQPIWHFEGPGRHGIDLAMLSPALDRVIVFEVKGTLRPRRLPGLSRRELRQMSTAWMDKKDNPGMASLELEHALDFLSRRIFGPDRLKLLRSELSRAEAATWREHDDERDRLQRELADIDRSLYRQTLRLEEHDDPAHPIVALAGRRIEELSARRESITQAISALETERPASARPEEIEAMLDAVPDLRPALATYSETELADLLNDFDVTATYDKAECRRLKLGATLTPELVAAQETKRPPGGRPRSRISSIAGAGFEPATFGL